MIRKKDDVTEDVPFINIVAPLFVTIGFSESSAGCVELAVIVRSFSVTLMVGESLSCVPSLRWISSVGVCTAYACLIVLHGRSLHPQ